MNEWTEDEDRLVTPEQLADACVLKGPLEPQPGTKYIITADIGVKIDPTAIAVTHTVPDPTKPRTKRVIVDQIIRYVPTKKKEVNLGVVEETIRRLSWIYNRARVHGDPSQFHQMRQNLSAGGVNVQEYKFSSPSVGELAAALVLALVNRQIELPDKDELKVELAKVRLRSMTPGTYRLDHDQGAHDDQAVVLGMACHLHLGGLGGVGHAWLDHLRRAKEEQDINPAKALPPRSPQSYFLGARLEDSMPHRACQHRWWTDGRCVKCGQYEEVVDGALTTSA